MANTIITALGGRSFPVYQSVARTATPNSMEYRNLNNASGIVLLIDVTAVDATPSLTVSILGVDPFVDKTWTLLTSAAIVGVSTVALKVCPGITAATNLAVADALPSNIRIVATHGDADSITYSVSAHLIS